MYVSKYVCMYVTIILTFIFLSFMQPVVNLHKRLAIYNSPFTSQSFNIKIMLRVQCCAINKSPSNTTTIYKISICVHLILIFYKNYCVLCSFFYSFQYVKLSFDLYYIFGALLPAIFGVGHLTHFDGKDDLNVVSDDGR